MLHTKQKTKQTSGQGEFGWWGSIFAQGIFGQGGLKRPSPPWRTAATRFSPGASGIRLFVCWFSGLKPWNRQGLSLICESDNLFLLYTK